MYRNKLIILSLIWLSALTASAEITVNAAFNPSRIMLGDKSRYVVEIRETSSTSTPELGEVTSLPIPDSGGLNFSNPVRVPGGLERVRINGFTQYSIRQQLILDAEPSSVGSFSIPAYSFQYKGEMIEVPAARLQVIERGADAPPPTSELIFLRIDTPEQLYIGQSTNITLKMYLSEHVRLSDFGNFNRTTDGFTTSDLPEGTQSTEIYNGRNYRVISWPFTITPILTGYQDLAFEFTVIAQLPRSNKQNDPFGGRLQAFGITTNISRTERFTIYTEPTQIEVLPLPQEDQPNSFSGAIGQFDLEVYTDRNATTQGEPIMLSIEIDGRGNFERISGPTLSDDPSWRSYEPESTFTPLNESNTAIGSKRFDYVIIPQQAGHIETPSVVFSYFDPETESYIEIEASTFEIEISPSRDISPAAQTRQHEQNVINITPQPMQLELSVEEALLTLDYRHDAKTDTNGGVLFRAPTFWIANFASAIALCFIYARLKHQRRMLDDAEYSASHLIKKEYASSKKAAESAADLESFYPLAQQSIRLAATMRTGHNFRTANSSEITKCGLPIETVDRIDQLFRDADANRFANKASSGDLEKAKSELERILKAL